VIANFHLPTIGDYEFCIARSDRARDLHDLTAEIGTDESLTPAERDALIEKIRLKFSAMNARAIGQRDVGSHYEPRHGTNVQSHYE
jgi:hypothetical protein